MLVLLLVGAGGGGDDRIPTSSRSSLVGDDDAAAAGCRCCCGCSEFLLSCFAAVAAVGFCFCCDRGEKEEKEYVSSGFAVVDLNTMLD